MEVENALSNESYLQDIHKSNTLVLDQTKDIAAINKTKYKEGNGEFLNYLSSKIALVQSQRQNLQLKYNKLKNRINLYLALATHLSNFLNNEKIFTTLHIIRSDYYLCLALTI